MKWANDGDTNGGWKLHALGLANYRAGQYEEAIKCSNKSLAFDPSQRAGCWLVMAMAHQQLGHTDEARRCLGTARRIIAVKNPENLDQQTSIRQPADWVGVHLLSREAVALIENSTVEAAPPSTNTQY